MDPLTIILAGTLTAGFVFGLPRLNPKRYLGEEPREEHAATSSPKTESIALRQAVAQSSLPAIKNLIKSGVDLGHRYEDGKTILHLACESSSLEVFEGLLNCGANPMTRDQQGRTPLLYAVEEGRMDVTSLLIGKRMDISAMDNKGRTAVLIAAEHGHVGIVRALYEAHNVTLADHMLAVQRARLWNHREVITFLEKEGAHFVFPQGAGSTRTRLETSNLMIRKDSGTTAENSGRLEHMDQPEDRQSGSGENARGWGGRRAKNKHSEGDGGSRQQPQAGDKLPPAMPPQPLAYPMASSSQILYDLISHQISQPSSSSTYLNQVIEAASSISESPHDLTQEEGRIFATLYQAIFQGYAKNDTASAESHLTAAKVIAKKLHLESELEMNRSFGPEPRLYALSVRSVSKKAISQFVGDVGRVLEKNKQAGSFGSLFNVGISKNTRVMCCVFGSTTPDKFLAPTELTCEGISASVLVIQDSINRTGSLGDAPASWLNQPVHDAMEVDLSGYSVGEQGDMEEAGTFGFYGGDDERVIYGFTAAHCTPQADRGSVIVSPSARELTGRLENIVPYTSFAPNPRRIHSQRESEVRSLLGNWINEECREGCLIRERIESDEGSPARERKVKLLGWKLGTVKGKSATYKFNIVEEHNRRLEEEKARGFNLSDIQNELHEEEGSRKTLSRIEWCCFEVLRDRFGGNRLNSDTRQDEAVRGISLLMPDMKVSKIGRTTKETNGTVNGCVLQRWVDNTLTTEIGVVGGGGKIFGDVGDSGSLVVTENDGEPYGVGMLIGKNVRGGLGLVSPLWAVLEDAKEKLEQNISFLAE